MMVDQRADRHERIKSGFSLLELLVVVAILAILVAIAVPNYLQAQTRAKVARAKVEMKTLEVAIQTYYVDWKAYPLMWRINSGMFNHHAKWFGNYLHYDGNESETLAPGGGCPNNLTTPVAYLAAPPPPDPFIGSMALWNTGSNWNDHGRRNCSYFFYNFRGAVRRAKNISLRFNGPGGLVYKAHWALLSPGPDCSFKVENSPGYKGNPWLSIDLIQLLTYQDLMLRGDLSLYDPSNGTVSGGDIWRTNQGILQ